MLDIPRAGPNAIAELIALHPELWMVVVFSPEVTDEGIARIIAEGERLEECVGRTFLRLSAPSASELLRQARQQVPTSILVVRGVEKFDEAELRDLDQGRNQLLGMTILFCTTEAGLGQLAAFCPNIFSWVGGQCVVFEGAEGVMDVEERLESLRGHFKLTDDAVIEMAKQNALPPDPAFVEWLALLGRGDLLGS